MGLVAIPENGDNLRTIQATGATDLCQQSFQLRVKVVELKELHLSGSGFFPAGFIGLCFPDQIFRDIQDK